MNGFPKHNFVRLSLSATYILDFLKNTTSKIVNSATKGMKGVLAQANEILNQTLNIHIQNHLVEGSRKKMES